MSDTTIGKLNIGIGMDGTQEVSKSLSQIQRNLKIATEQFKANAAGIDKNNASVEELTGQQQQLNTIMELQKAKAKTLEAEWKKVAFGLGENSKEAKELYAEYEKVAQESGENSKEAKKLYEQYQKLAHGYGETSKEAMKLENAFLQNNKEMNKTERQAKELQTAIDHLGDESVKSAKEMDKMQTEMKDTGGGAGKLGGSMKALAGAIVAAFSVSAITGFSKSIVEASAELDALNSQYSQVMGKMKNDTDKYLTEMGRKWNKHPDELKSAYTQYVAILKSKGVAEKDAHNLAKQYLERTVDANAFANESMSDTTARFMGGIKGEYDSLDTAMVNLSATMLDTKAQEKYKKKFSELTVTQQETLKAQEALRQHTSAGVFGQGERESQSYANNLAMLQNTWKELKAQLGAPLLEKVNEAFSKLVGYIGQVDVDKIMTGFSNFGNYLKTNFGPFIEGIKNSLVILGETVSTLFGKITEAFNKAGGDSVDSKELISQYFQSFLLMIDWLIQGVTKLIEFLTPAITAIATFMGEQTKKISEFWNEHGAEIMESVIIVVDAIVVTFQRLWRVLEPILTFIMKTIGNIIDTGLNVVMGLFEFFSAMIHGDFKGMKEAGLKITLDMINGLVNLFKNIWGMLKGVLGGLVENIKDVFHIDLKQIGIDMINGLIKGINSMIGKVRDKVTGLAKDIPKWLKDMLGIHSPSLVLKNEVGQWIPLGLADGINSQLKTVQEAANKMAAASIPTIQPNQIANSVNTTTNFNPNITINGGNPFQQALETQRMLRRVAFQGGLAK